MAQIHPTAIVDAGARLADTVTVGPYAGERIDRVMETTLTFNPSHLEFVNPVVEGRVRAKQDRRADRNRSRVMPLLIHDKAI